MITTYDWGELLMVSHFIVSGAYVVVASQDCDYANVLDALKEYVGGEFKQPPIIISAVSLSQPAYDYFLDNCNPDLVI